MASQQLSRIVSFRLSAEEYKRCCQICVYRGVASVSELARNALELFSEQPSADAIERRLTALETKLEELEREIKQDALPEESSLTLNATPSN